MNDLTNQVTLYDCLGCGALHQAILTECDCTVGEKFTYNLLTAYRHTRREEMLLKAAGAVCEFDWSDNDEDAVKTIHGLFEALEPYRSKYTETNK